MKHTESSRPSFNPWKLGKRLSVPENAAAALIRDGIHIQAVDITARTMRPSSRPDIPLSNIPRPGQHKRLLYSAGKTDKTNNGKDTAAAASPETPSGTPLSTDDIQYVSSALRRAFRLTLRRHAIFRDTHRQEARSDKEQIAVYSLRPGNNESAPTDSEFNALYKEDQEMELAYIDPRDDLEDELSALETKYTDEITTGNDRHSRNSRYHGYPEAFYKPTPTTNQQPEQRDGRLQAEETPDDQQITDTSDTDMEDLQNRYPEAFTPTTDDIYLKDLRDRYPEAFQATPTPREPRITPRRPPAAPEPSHVANRSTAIDAIGSMSRKRMGRHKGKIRISKGMDVELSGLG